MKKPKIISTLFILTTFLVIEGCTNLRRAQNVKLVSFGESAQKGVSLGPITGEDCAWTIFSYKFGTPKLDLALTDAREKKNGRVRYINNMSTENGGFNAGIVKKDCISVKGTAYGSNKSLE